MFGKANDNARLPPVPSTENIGETDSSMRDTEYAKENSTQATNLDRPIITEESTPLQALKHKIDPDVRPHETAASNYMTSIVHQGSDSLVPGRQHASDYGREGPETSYQQGAQTSHLSPFISLNKLPKTEGTVLTGTRISNVPSRESPGASMIHQELPAERVETYSNQSCILKGNDFVGKPLKPDSPMSIVKEQNTQIIGKESGIVKHMVNPSKNLNMFFNNVSPSERLSAASDLAVFNNVADTYPGSVGTNDQRASGNQKHDGQQNYSSDGFRMTMVKNSLSHGSTSILPEKSVECDDGNNLESNDAPAPPPRYTTSETWIMNQQKRKLAEEQKFPVKQRKAKEKITASFNKLKVYI